MVQLRWEFSLGWDPIDAAFPMESARRQVNLYKRIRTLLSGDYYPLTACALETTWVAYQFHRSDSNSGFALIFRRSDSDRVSYLAGDSFLVRLRGMDPGLNYKVEYQAGRSERIVNGRALMQGTELAISKGPAAEMIYLRADPAMSIGDRVRRKMSWRILPFFFLLYIVSYLDRANVAFAKLPMLADLKFSEAVFGTGAGIFFLGYFLLEIPGALIVEKWSARLWIARILVTWGLCTVLVGFVKTPIQFYGARFLLGLAEAGFFPGVIVYMTHWYPARPRSRDVRFDSGRTAVVPAWRSALRMVSVLESFWSYWLAPDIYPAGIAGCRARIHHAFLSDRPPK